MKMMLITFYVFSIFIICGCSKEKPHVEVAKDNFSKFESSEFTKVFIYINGSKVYPEQKRQSLYFYEFPINDPVKVEVIKRCIKDANQTEYDRERFSKKRAGEGIDRGLFVFETKKLRYTMLIGWDDKSVYGTWWESPELLSIFRGWGLFEDLAKADPNWPPIKWIGTPSGERVPFTTEPNSSHFRKGPYSRGRDINEKSFKKEMEIK